jgi:lysophospholipase L1-like esterase
MPTERLFKRESRILFIGDSITDGDRSRTGDENHALGDTYVRLIAARYGADHPLDDIRFMNRGINGDRVVDLEARWKGDCLELAPDILTILVGVNDAASVVELTIPPPPRADGRPPKSLVTGGLFVETYERLLNTCRSQLPKVKLVLGTPFVLPVDKIGRNWDLWKGEVDQRSESIRTLAKAHGASLLELQPLLDRAVTTSPAHFWMPDGVHPSAAGHQLLADEWMRVAKAMGKDD